MPRNSATRDEDLLALDPEDIPYCKCTDVWAPDEESQDAAQAEADAFNRGEAQSPIIITHES